MKTYRAIVITRIIFVISILYSYNANASLYNAINSLLSLVNEICVKQYQSNQQDTSIFSDSNLNSNIALLRVYHASLLARQQPGSVASKDIFMKKMKKQASRCLPGDSDQRVVQVLTELMSVTEGLAYFQFPGSGSGSGTVYGIPQFGLYCEADKLKDEEIYEKAKELLSKIYKSLESDQVFLTTCTNFGLESDYKITIELISTALHYPTFTT